MRMPSARAWAREVAAPALATHAVEALAIAARATAAQAISALGVAALGVAALGVAALAIAASGCTFLPIGGSPTAAPAAKPSPMGHGLNEYRAAFHVHCRLSHDSDGRVEEIARAARSLGLDTVILDDHYKPGNIEEAPRGIHHGVLFVPGVELGAGAGPGSGGSLLAFPVESDFDNRLSAAARCAEMARQGAVTAVGHVEENVDWSLGPFQAFEVYNLHAQFKAESGWAIAARLLFCAPDAFFEAAIKPPAENLALWDRELARGRRLAALAGHDAHANVRILGAVIGTYPEMFRLFSNHILARALTVEEIAGGVRAGRTFVAFDFLGDGTGFAVSYGEKGAPPGARAILGDAAPFRAEQTLDVEVPAGRRGRSGQDGSEGPGAPAHTRVLRDARSILETELRSFQTTLPGPGIYRVEVYREKRLWILSSPIYITP